MTQFPKTLRAAKAVSTDEKALAEAIYVEIPPRTRGPQPKDSRPIDGLLADLAIDLAAEGHVYSPDTLRIYREVAAWSAKGGNADGPDWQPVAWSMHREAFTGGMTWATFVKHVANGVKTVDDLRRLMNKQPTRKNKPDEKLADVGAALKAGELTPKQVADTLAEAGMTEDVIDSSPEPAVTEVFHKQRRRRLQRDIDNGAEGMTPDEVDEFDHTVSAINETADAIDAAAKGMADEVEGPVARRIRIAVRETSMACVVHKKQGLRDGEQDVVLDHLIDLRHAADLLEMAIEGKKLSTADQKFLEACGIAV